MRLFLCRSDYGMHSNIAGATKIRSERVQALRMGRGKDLKDKTHLFDEVRATGRVWPGGKEQGAQKKSRGLKKGQMAQKKGIGLKKSAVGSKMGRGLKKGQRYKKRGEGLKKGELFPNPLPRQVVSLRIRLSNMTWFPPV